jgi:tetratricopeptide (TPR) repeat protein
MTVATRTGIFGFFGFAHSRVFSTFPPYRIACFIAIPALVIAACGFALLPSGWSSNWTNVVIPPGLTGDYATCNNSNRGLSQDDAKNALAACEQIQNGAAQGSGSLPPDKVYAGEALANDALNDYKDALSEINQAIAANATVENYYLTKSFIDNDSGDYADGKQDAVQALSMAPGDLPALREKAYAELQLSDFQSALTDSGTAISGDGSNELAYYVHGAAEAQLNDYADAVQDETKALSIRPNMWYSLYWRGYAEAHQIGSETTAINDLNASLGVWSHNADAYDQLAAIALRQGDNQTAISDETTALSNRPNDALALNTRAGAEIRMSYFHAAQADALAALNLNPTGQMRGWVYENLGLAEYNQNDFQDAVYAFEQAEQYDPTNPRLPAHLAEAKQHLQN